MFTSRVNVIASAHCLEVLGGGGVPPFLRLAWLRRLFRNRGTPARPTPTASFPQLNVTGCLWSWHVETAVVPSSGVLLRQSTYCVKRWQVLRKISSFQFFFLPECDHRCKGAEGPITVQKDSRPEMLTRQASEALQ